MNILEATVKYERWKSGRIRLVRKDVGEKHRLMAEASFPFLRATFYRWVQIWPELCPEAAAAPRLLGVGDLHIENFGTWRDHEGRLIWGVNDFDEAYVLPYTNDLVRLAASALLAIAAKHLELRPKEACTAILEGYRECLEQGGEPFVLAERHAWLRDIAAAQLAAPERFWGLLGQWPEARPGEVAPAVRKMLEARLPARKMKYRIVKRQAGLGSRGHQRLVAVADWGGGKVAREAKALGPAAPVWLDELPAARRRPSKTTAPRNPQAEAASGVHEAEKCPLFVADAIANAVRIQDPCYAVQDGWVLRRLAPDCHKVTLDFFPARRNELRMLHAMGWETGNVHLGNRGRLHLVKRDLDRRPARWLLKAARTMAEAVVDDWRDWKKKSS
jgi:hypothetical protein